MLPTMIVFGFLVQAMTGIVLWLYYSPSSQTAWESVFYMQYILPCGWMVRGIHHYSAQVLVGLLSLYLLLLVLRGKYRTPREFVFWSGVGLFFLALGACITGDFLNGSLSGFSATKVRVSFLNLLPEIGPWLYQLAVGGADFGTLSYPRFLVLHIAVCGGAFFGVAALWLWFKYRAEKTALENAPSTCSDKTAKPSCCCDSPANRVSFWSCEAVKRSFACLVFIGLVLLLVYQQPLLGKVKKEWAPDPNLPYASTVGAELMSPADPADFFGGARPEWSFRALYYFSNLECFPGERKYIPIFVIPSCLGIYCFLIPFIGRLKIGHYLNVLIVLGLVGSVGYMTYESYEHDAGLEDYQREVRSAKLKAERAIELAFAPEGIPPTGAITLLRNDPKLQGPVLYTQHCASCHPFRPFAGEAEHVDFPSIPCETPTAPNLYRPIRFEWVKGFFDFKMLTSDDYFGNTAFNLQPGQDKKDFHGKMYDYVRSLPARMEDEDFSEENNPETLQTLIEVLTDEARRDAPRAFELGEKKAKSIEGLSLDTAYVLDSFGCLASCHRFYDYDAINKVVDGPDLTGYMSREWMIGFISNPSAPQFYGTRNDRMQSYHLSDADAILSKEEVAILVDWLRDKWYRKPVAAVE